MRRAVLIAAVLALSVSGVTTVALAGEAGAVGSIICTTVGNPLYPGETMHLSGCTGGATGGSSVGVSIGLPTTGSGLITWASGSSTHLITVRGGPVAANKCPGYVKGAGNNPIALKLSGTVISDIGNGIKVPGKFRAGWCGSPTGDLSALGTWKFS